MQAYATARVDSLQCFDLVWETRDTLAEATADHKISLTLRFLEMRMRHYMHGGHDNAYLLLDTSSIHRGKLLLVVTTIE